MMDTRPEDETPMEAEDDPAEDSLINADVSAEDEQDAVEEEHEDADMVEQVRLILHSSRLRAPLLFLLFFSHFFT